MPEVKVVNLWKSFGKRVVLKGVNLEVEDGEYFVIVGPTGSGKTTLLMILAGILKPDRGEIYFDGELVNDIPPEDRRVGLVLEKFALFPHYTVMENLLYGPVVRGEDLGRALNVAKEMLRMVLLEDRPDAMPTELSGGMKQRVALARALTAGARLLLLDEPLGALDARIRASLRYDLVSMVKDMGLTAIHVTNSIEEAMEIADRMAVMRDGVIEQVGTPMEVYENPVNIFVADFMSELNVFNAEVVSTGDGWTELRTEEGFTLRCSKGPLEKGMKVLAAVRAEDVDLEHGLGHGVNAVPGRVVDVEFILGFYRYVLDVDGRTLVAEEFSDWRVFKQGDEVTAKFRQDKILLFKQGRGVRVE